MNRLLLLFALAIFLGCSGESPDVKPTSARPEPPSDLVLGDGEFTFPGEVDYAGELWQRASQMKTEPTGYLFLYTAANRDDVLVYHLFPPENQIRRHIAQAVANDDTKTWTPDGISESITKNNFRVVTELSFGKRHGLHRIFTNDGTKVVEIPYREDVISGNAKGWYADGKPKWEATLTDGKVVESIAWDKEGEIIEDFDFRKVLP